MPRRASPLVALGLAALLAAPAVVRPEPAAALSCGPCPAVASDQVNLRSTPGLDSEVLRVIPAGAELQWDFEPAAVDGYVPVLFDGTAGWAHDDYLLLYPASATALSPVNQRDAPSLGAAVVGVLPAGESLILLNGPRRADGHDWYQAHYQSGTPGTALGGWVAGDVLDLELR